MKYIDAILEILRHFAKPFAKWWESRQQAKQAEMKAELHSLRLKRLDIKRQMKNAKGEERAKLKEIYDNINNRILYLERILHDN